MVKIQVTIMIESELLRKLDNYRRKVFPDLSRSTFISMILREYLRGRGDISVVR